MSQVINTSHFIDKSFQGSQGDMVPLDAVLAPTIVLYYVGAKWCPNCKKFSELLDKFYRTVNEKEKRLEIVYLSVDANESDFKAQQASFPWVSVSFEKNENVRKFLHENEITQIPSVLLVKKEDGLIWKKDCRGDIQKNPTGCFEHWVKVLSEHPQNELSKSINLNESRASGHK